mgnify:CR=1 FL=1
MFGLHLRTLRKLFGDSRKNLHTFYRIDAEVAFQIHVGIDGFGGVAGLIGDDGQEDGQDIGLRRIRHACYSRNDFPCR